MNQYKSEEEMTKQLKLRVFDIQIENARRGIKALQTFIQQLEVTKQIVLDQGE